MPEPANPFPTLEVIHDHVESAMSALGRQEGADLHGYRQRPWPLGSPQYHLVAAEAATCRLYQQLAKLLPGARALDERDVTDTILEQIDGEEGAG